MKRILTLGFLGFGLVAFAVEPVQHVSVEGVEASPLRASGSADIVIQLKIKPGFHIQANPASKPNLIATKVDVAASGQIEVGRATYPPSKPYKVPGLDTTVATYDGQIEVRVPVQATANIQPGKLSLEGRVKYQACDDKVCFPPTVAKFTALVDVVDSKAAGSSSVRSKGG